MIIGKKNIKQNVLQKKECIVVKRDMTSQKLILDIRKKLYSPSLDKINK